MLLRTRGLSHRVFSRQIYKQKMHGSKYVWVIHTPDKYGWWNRYFKGVNCTPEEVNKGANGILQVNYMWLSTSRRKTVAGTVRHCVKRGLTNEIRNRISVLLLTPPLTLMLVYRLDTPTSMSTCSSG